MRVGRVPARLQAPQRAHRLHRGGAPAREGSGEPARLALREPGRPRRLGRRLRQGLARPVRLAQRALRHRRRSTRGARGRARPPSTARPTSSPKASTRSPTRRRTPTARPTSSACAPIRRSACATTRASCATRPRRPWPATSTACAPSSATRSSTTSASPTAPFSARRTCRCSRTASAGPSSTGRSTPTSTSTTRCRTCAEQTAAFERALQRFFMACAAAQEACLGFGGDDPHLAYDALIRAADAAPVPAGDAGPAVTGQDMLERDDHHALRQADLAAARAGPGLRAGGRRDPDAPAHGRGLRLRPRDGAIRSRHGPLPHDRGGGAALSDGPGHVLPRRPGRSWGSFDHFWFNAGYVELNWGLFPVQGRPVYRGPFDVPAAAQTPLVVERPTTPPPPTGAACAWPRTSATRGC